MIIQELQTYLNRKGNLLNSLLIFFPMVPPQYITKWARYRSKVERTQQVSRDLPTRVGIDGYLR